MEFDNYKNLWFDAMCLKGDTAWIFANNFNALFELNLSTEKLSFLGIVPNEDLYSKGLYENILIVGNKLVLVPFMAKTICIYDIDAKEFSNIPLEMQGCKCFGAASYGDKVFLVGYNSARIISLDINTKSVKYILDCEEYFASRKLNNGKYFFRKNSCVVNGCFYIASCVCDTIVKLDMVTEKIEFIELSPKSDGLMSISFDGKVFWITKYVADSVIRWDESNHTVEYILIPEGIIVSSEIICCDNEVLIFPTRGKHVIGINKNNFKPYILEIFETYIKDQNEYPWGNQKFTCVIMHEGHIYCFFADEMVILKYSRVNGTIDIISVDITNAGIEEQLVRNTAIINENNENSIEFFIKGLGVAAR